MYVTHARTTCPPSVGIKFATQNQKKTPKGLGKFGGGRLATLTPFAHLLAIVIPIAASGVGEFSFIHY